MDITNRKSEILEKLTDGSNKSNKLDESTELTALATLVFSIFQEIIPQDPNAGSSDTKDTKIQDLDIEMIALFKTSYITQKESDSATYNFIRYLYDEIRLILVDEKRTLGGVFKNTVEHFRDCNYDVNTKDVHYHFVWFLFYQIIGYEIIKLEEFNVFTIVNLLYPTSDSGDGNEQQRQAFVERASRDLFLSTNTFLPYTLLKIKAVDRVYYYRAGNVFKLRGEAQNKADEKVVLNSKLIEYFTGIDETQLNEFTNYLRNFNDIEKREIKKEVNKFENRPLFRNNSTTLLKQLIRIIFIKDLYRKTNDVVFNYGRTEESMIVDDEVVEESMIVDDDEAAEEQDANNNDSIEELESSDVGDKKNL